MAYYNLSTLDFFGYLQISKYMISGENSFKNMIKNEYEPYNQFCCLCFGSSENQNLSNAQRDFLLWNWKWWISMHIIQEMMKSQQVG